MVDLPYEVITSSISNPVPTVPSGGVVEAGITVPALPPVSEKIIRKLVTVQSWLLLCNVILKL